MRVVIFYNFYALTLLRISPPIGEIDQITIYLIYLSIDHLNHDLSCVCTLVAQNAELFTLTYGAMVMQLIQDFEDVGAVNKQLESM